MNMFLAPFIYLDLSLFHTPYIHTRHNSSKCLLSHTNRMFLMCIARCRSLIRIVNIALSDVVEIKSVLIEAGGCASFNQSYKNGGFTAQGQPVSCWDKIINESFQRPLFFTFMLGTNDAIQQYVDACFSRDIEKATQSYFQSVLSMLTEIRQKFSDAFIVLMRPIKNFAYQVQPNVFFYDQMINQTYENLESFVRQDPLFKDDQKFLFIDLWTLTNKTIQEMSSLSYTCDYTHPTDNLNKVIGDYLANLLKPHLPKTPSGNSSSYYKCSI